MTLPAWVPITLALVVGAAVALSAWDLARWPLLRRLVLRGLRRRPGEAALAVLGALLGTAVVCSAFVVGDTLAASVRDTARTRQGPIDEAVVASGPGAVADLEAAFEGNPPGIDGTLAVVSAPVVVTRELGGDERRSSPRALLHELDVPAARAFGGDEEATGFASVAATPDEGTALVGRDLADDLDARRGDRLDVFLYGRRVEVEVAGILPRLGVAGFSPEPGSRSPVLFVTPGTLAATLGPELPPDPPRARLLVSNDGGVLGGAASTDEVVPVLQERAAGVAGASVERLKADVLDQAAADGSAATRLLGAVGALSAIAGGLLLVNVFVLLVDERRSELGTLRAIGLRRSRLARALGAEGVAYALVGAVLGGGLGVLVGRAVVGLTEGLVADGRAQLDLRFSATAGGVGTGILIGAVLGLVTVWATSVRIARLHPATALRGLVAPRRHPRHPPGLATGAVGVLVGVVLCVAAVTRGGPAVVLGPAALALGAALLLTRTTRRPRRLAVTLPAAVALAWTALSPWLVPSAYAGSGTTVFVAQGVVMVGAAVAVAVANADLVPRVHDRFGRRAGGLATRLGLAHPLARRARTGLLLGMFSLVVFSLAFLAVVTAALGDRVAAVAAATGAGYDLLVDANPATPVPDETLEQAAGVTATAALARGVVDVEVPDLGRAARPWVASGFDQALLAEGGPALSGRADRFATDEAAWQATLEDPALAVVPPSFLRERPGPGARVLDPGDTFTVVDPSTGAAVPLTVAAVTESDVQLDGLLDGRPVHEGLLGALPSSRHYVAVDGTGAEEAEVASSLQGRLAEYGVEASTVEAVVDRALSEQRAFLRLLQGFLSLGLVTGIGGLGVVLVRAVRDRRQEIGVLRATGVRAEVVRRAFLVEAGFLAGQGVMLGVGLGVVGAAGLLSHADLFGTASVPLTIPWGVLAVLTVVPVAAALAAAAVPASRAAAVRPAVALRTD